MMRSFTRRVALLGAGAALLPFARPLGTAAPPTPEPAVRRASTPVALPDPGHVALGLFVPGAPADPRPLDLLAEEISRMPAFVCWYEAWGSAEAVTGETIELDKLQAVVNRGATPFITWEPWDPAAGAEQPAYRAATIARGAFDAYVDAWATRLAAWNGPVYLRMLHELNAAWYPWGVGVNGNTPEDLVAAWRHVRGRFDRAGAGNVRWVWCPDAGPGETPLAALYPGDEYVDWVALDGYNWGEVRPETGWRSFEEIFGPAYDELGRLTGRPLMVAETASSERGGDKAAWITNAFAALPERFPRVRALSWFNEATAGADWPVTSSAGALAAFAEAATAAAMWGRLP